MLGASTQVLGVFAARGVCASDIRLNEVQVGKSAKMNAGSNPR